MSTPVTYLALNGQLPSVSPDVNLQVLAGLAAYRALGALEWLKCGVGPTMGVEVATGEKFLTALTAHKGLAARDHRVH